MSRALTDALVKLLTHGDDAPATLFTAAQRSALDTLARTTGFLSIRPKGRGLCYQIGKRSGLEAHLRNLRPDAPHEIAADLPQRSANIATGRDSKAGPTAHDRHYLLLKAVGKDVTWYHTDSCRLDLAALTETAGAGVLAIKTGDNWISDQPLWLVENQALFDDTTWLPMGTRASVAYYAGQLPHRLVAWLAEKARVPEVILFADYDGVGLQNFVRLRERLKSPCSVWLMPGWHALLCRYGSNQIWQDNHGDFVAATSRLCELDPPAELLALCGAMSQEGLALEHEAVWLAFNGDPTKRTRF